jgi:hypothetical protein
MTADALNLLAEVRRSGGDVKLISGDRLKLIAPTKLMPELAKRVRAAKPMLLAALADTGRKGGNRQGGGGGVVNPRRNRATAQHLPAEPYSDRAIGTLAPDWYARHREALAYWSAFHAAGEATRLAWGELECRWHRLHGERVPEWQCAGCREPVGGMSALHLSDGNRVHCDRLDCLIRYGERWRGAASLALSAMCLEPPAGEDHPA